MTEATGRSGSAQPPFWLIPGSGHVVRGRIAKGLAFLLPWLALVAITVNARTRIAAVPRTGSFDDWLATITLAGSLAGLWIAAAIDLAHGPHAAGPGESQWRIAGRYFRRNRLAVAGLWIIAILYLAMLLAPLITPYDPIAQIDITHTRNLPPTLEHLFGTDHLGRDIFSRVLYGARVSLTIGFVATAISITLGTMLGAIAGYAGGKVDAAIMRFTDLVLSFPRLVLLLLIVAMFGSSVTVLIIVLGLTQWPTTTRIVRGDVLSLREREFVQAARSLGFRSPRILFRHIVPNVLAPVIVSATLGVGNTIVLEAGLSFLGLGPPPPTPTWGGIVNDGRVALIDAWWIATFPGLTIVLVVLAFNLVGDGLRDALDPRLRQG
jgi:peptide/nickel transport system permease protein